MAWYLPINQQQKAPRDSEHKRGVEGRGGGGACISLTHVWKGRRQPTPPQGATKRVDATSAAPATHVLLGHRVDDVGPEGGVQRGSLLPVRTGHLLVVLQRLQG